MKRRMLRAMLVVATIITMVLGLAACNEEGLGGTGGGQQSGELWSMERVYAAAKDLGFEGTLEELIAMFKGEQGAPGKDGVGVLTMIVNVNGELIVILTDGTEINLGPIGGGQKGDTGAPGKSAYEIWLDNGHTGTEEDFLNWLRGDCGEQGKSAYDIWLENGHTGTEEDFLNWLRGGYEDPSPEHTEHVDINRDDICDVCGEYLGTVTPPDEDPGYADRRVDPRAVDAYEAYDYTGRRIGTYKTIADAINATVAADLDYMENWNTLDGAYGGYVIKKNGVKHLFDNRKGFGPGNSDQFWYYENGTELAGYNCWDFNNSMETITNSKVITHETTTMGLNSVQFWNGYALLDEFGQPITDGTTAQTWELSSPMDASVLMFTPERMGVAGLKYKIDLTEIQITPPYEGVEDKVYAFIGFYAWQGYYVVANGIACDTETGDWYEYLGTSRDDSFSDVQYNIGKKLMSSTWTASSDVKGDGYWTPNAKELVLEIKTIKIANTVGNKVPVDQFTVTLDGKVAHTSTIGDEMVNNLFAGAIYSADNSYVFTAGLDIKNPIETSVRVRNVDYFNGAKFLGLAVKEAAVYFPTEEELTDKEAMTIIRPELRGRWIDMLLANDIPSEGAYAYTVLQTYACTTYEAKDGVDYYSFRYDASPVSEYEIGGRLKIYQDIIDSLRSMTVDNVPQYIDVYDQVGVWYGGDENHTNSYGVLQQYLLLLDFSAYVAAQDIYREYLRPGPEAQAILAELETFGVLTNYIYRGWETAGDDFHGYLWSEVQAFGALYARYLTLEKNEQSAILRLYSGGEDEFYNWLDAYESISEYRNDRNAMNAVYTVASVNMDGTYVSYTGEEALATLFELGYELWCNIIFDAWEQGVFNSDSTYNYYRAFHILFLMQKMDEAGVEIPYFFTNIVYAQLTSTSNSKAFADDFNGYIYPVLTLAGEIYARQQRGEVVWLDAEMAEIINRTMVGFERFAEAGFNWNSIYNSDLRDVNTNYECYFGLPDANRNFKASLQYIIDVVMRDDPNAQLNASGLGFVNPVTALTEAP